MLRERIASIILNVITLGTAYVESSTHREMVHNCCEKFCYSTLQEFITAFNKIEWTGEKAFRSDSLFGKNSRCHASIIEIDGVGYILTTYGYLVASKMIKDKARQLFFDGKQVNVPSSHA